SLLYAACFLGLGFIFCNQIGYIGALLAQIGGSAFALVAALVLIWVGCKFWRRQTVLRELRMARISVEELRQKQAAGEPLVILDLRATEDVKQDPELIRGAIYICRSMKSKPAK